MPDTRIYVGQQASIPSSLHARAYEQQRRAEPSEALLAIAWNQFSSADVRIANPDHFSDRVLIDRVAEICQRKKIDNIPEIYIIGSQIPNAASVSGEGLIFTTKLLDSMTPEALDAVIGHELSHHRHIRRDVPVIIGLGAAGNWLGQEAWLRGTSHLARTALSPKILPVLHSRAALALPAYLGMTLPIVPYRHFLEYEADREGALATSPKDMQEALRTLQLLAQKPESDRDRSIGNRIVRTLLYPFSSHPPTEKRIDALDKLEKKLATERLQSQTELARG
jgi:Zn-dependent protease with chaperone function